jgi:hypothetical protein
LFPRVFHNLQMLFDVCLGPFLPHSISSFKEAWSIVIHKAPVFFLMMIIYTLWCCATKLLKFICDLF